MFKLDSSVIPDSLCDECESFSLSSRFNEHDESVIEYYCYNCKAEWVEYV